MDELRQREGDQPLPVEGQLLVGAEAIRILRENWYFEPVVTALITELQARIDLGVKRYGQPLQTGNGRDWTRDALDEVLDSIHYTLQGYLEGEQRAYELFVHQVEIAFKLIKLRRAVRG